MSAASSALLVLGALFGEGALAAGLLSHYYASGPLKGSLLHDAPAPVYSPASDDQWNRIHHLLFTTTEDSSVPTYYLEPSKQAPVLMLQGTLGEEERQVALGRYLQERYASGSVKVRRIEGGDRPDFFFATSTGLGHLLRGARYRVLVAALEDELKASRLEGRTAEARILFQSDLWNRFDALGAGLHSENGKNASRRRLRNLLGRLIARIALSREELQMIRPNLPEIAHTYRAQGRDWRELLRASRDGYETTEHSRVAGLRRVFRIFMRVPGEAGGAACLEASFSPEASQRPPGCIGEGALAYGTQVLLVETLLVLSKHGELVHVPLVVNIQSRVFAPLEPGGDGRLDLADLPFVILHGSRLSLSSGRRQEGGLTPLDPDEPVPPSVGCFSRPRGATLLPARLVCTTCHGPTGRNLMRFMSTNRIDVLRRENTLAEEAVIRAKRASPDYGAVRRFFVAE
jgi:hypothetical protein